MKNLEQLLNSLIERWRVPFGEWNHRSPYKRVRIHKNYDTERTCVLFYSNNHCHWKVLRQVVSRESLLWQFVCENKLIKLTEYYWVCNWIFWENIYYDETHTEKLYKNEDYEYRLIESALKDESELESFILDNIKV